MALCRAGDQWRQARGHPGRCRTVEFIADRCLLGCHSGVARRAEPGIHILEACVHGFRARRRAAPRNDGLAVSAPSYAWDFSFLWGYRWLILWGLGVTILYTIATILLGLVIGSRPVSCASRATNSSTRRSSPMS